MTIPPLTSSAAGVALAQTKGAEVEQSQQAAISHSRQTQSEMRAESAEGLAATDGEDQRASDRDADGRRLWELLLQPKTDELVSEELTEGAGNSRDATGESGKLLDLSG